MRSMASLLVLMALCAPSSWAAPDCSRQAGSLPNPAAAPGTEDRSNPIKHIVVIMQENHSFDNYFGALNDPAFYGAQIDGLKSDATNYDRQGRPVKMHHETNLCVADPQHGWDAVHKDWNEGRLDGFVTTNDERGQGSRVMGYYSAADIPFYYALANTFSVGDRYFCSLLSQTFPNRFYLLAGTSFGHVKNDMPGSKRQFDQKTLFDTLDRFGVSWRYYSDSPGYLKLFQPMYLRDIAKIKRMKDYEADLKAGTLPSVVFLDASFDGEDEHPDADVQVGQAWTAAQIHLLMKSPAWKDSALFLTYDENGGFYDHVAPPEACDPDGVKPVLKPGQKPGDFAHYGFRVPFVAVSPFAKRHFVSHRTYDHTSIVRFIEGKFNLPALTARDANADPLSDVFDYAHPNYDVSMIPEAKVDPDRTCRPMATVSVPAGPVALESRKTGKCLDAGGHLHFSACNGADTQRFTFQADSFGTFQLKSLASRSCLGVEFEKAEITQVACAEEEDQGFELESARDGALQFRAWHGDFCLSTQPSSQGLRLVSCVDDGSVDFLPRGQAR